MVRAFARLVPARFVDVRSASEFTGNVVWAGPRRRLSEGGERGSSRCQHRRHCGTVVGSSYQIYLRDDGDGKLAMMREEPTGQEEEWDLADEADQQLELFDEVGEQHP